VNYRVSFLVTGVISVYVDTIDVEARDGQDAWARGEAWGRAQYKAGFWYVIAVSPMDREVSG
jgi:hypothetical protein